MDCGVCISVYDGDSASPYLEQWRTARKPNRCCECLRTIEPGQPYQFVSGCWDGDWSAYRTCADCYHIRMAFSCDGTWVFQTLWRDLEDSREAITTACFEKIETASAKQYLRDRWIAWTFKEDR